MKTEEKKTKQPKKKRRRKLVFLLIGAGALGVVYALFLLAATPGDLKERVRAAIKTSFEGKVFISRVRFSPLRGITVRDLRLTGENGEPFLYIRKLVLQHDLTALLRRKLVITNVIAETPQIMLTCSQKEGWNVQQLFKSGGGFNLSTEKAAISSVKIVGGSISMRDDSMGRTRFPYFLFRDINISTTPDKNDASKLHIYGSLVDNITGGTWPLSGTLDAAKSAVELAVSKKGIRLDEKVRKKIPPINLGAFHEVAALDGMANLDFKFSYACATRSRLHYDLRLGVEKCRTRIDNFPYTIDSLQGGIELRDGQVSLKDIRVASGNIRGTIEGILFPAKERDVRLTAKDIRIDETLIEQLGPHWRTTMERLKLRGMADASCRITESLSGETPFDYSVKFDLRDCQATGPEVPLPAEKVNGAITWNGQELSCRGLRGETPAGPFRVRDTTLNMDLESRRCIDVEMKDVAIDRLLAEFVGRKHNLQKQIASYKPAGRADIVCRISWDAGGKNTDYEITADFRDLRMTYPRLDRPLVGFAGKLKLRSNELYIETASGTCGKNAISIRDLRTRRDSGHIVSGRIKLEGWSIDKDLKAFVPRGPRSILDALNLKGHVNIAHRIDPDPQKTETVIHLLDCSAKYAAAPYPIYNITGCITYKQNTLVFENVKGNNGPAVVELKTKRLDLAKRGPLQIELSAKNLPLDTQLKSVLPESIIPYWDQFNPTGSVDSDLTVAFTVGEPKKVSVRTAVHWNRSGLQYVDFPYPVSDVTGTLEIWPDRIILKDIAGKAGTGQLRFLDTVIFRGGEYGLDLKIEGTDMSLDNRLRECLRKDVQAAWNIVNPSGRFNFTWRQTKGHGKDAPMDYSLRLELTNAEMTFAYFKYPLKQMRGTIYFAHNKAKFSNVVGHNGEATVVLSGYATGAPDVGEDFVSLKIDAKNVPLDEDLKRALPEEYHEAWENLRPKDRPEQQGTISASALVRYREYEQGQVVITYELAPLTFQDCRLELGEVPMDNIKGEIRLQGEVFPGVKSVWDNEAEEAPKPSSAASGSVNLTEISVAGKRYTELQVPKFVGMFYGGSDFEFHVPWIQAYLYGGRLTGEMSIDRAKKRYDDEDIHYTAVFKVTNVNTKDLVDLSGVDIRGIRGVLEAESKVKGIGLRPEALEASGMLTIEKGDMGNLPQHFGIPSRILRSTRFDRLFMKYRIKEAKAYIDTIEFKGEGGELKGRGRVPFKDQPAELIFRHYGGGPLARAVNEIFGGELKVKMGGRLDEPIWKVDPLVPLRNLVRGLASVLQIEKKNKDEPEWEEK
ncbi:MAG: hypothetical protein GXP25_00545 [Planctomycetes bacterium]|nr:hypothetical protein [Planctomycetota bacterium]